MSTRRIYRIRRLAAERGAEAALVVHRPDLRWAVGFTGSNGLLVVGPERAHFVTDGRYADQAREEVEGAEIHVPGYQLFHHVAGAGLLGGARHVLIQSDHLTVAQAEELRALLPGVEWRSAEGLLSREVAVKEEWEIERLRAAQRLTDAVFAEILPLIRPGVREREISAEIVYRLLRGGAEATSFEPIVASGPRGALPHARASSKEIRRGELVVLDFGGVLEGYASDMTRTVAVGPPPGEHRRVYRAVLDAQVAAVDAARAGIPARALDAVSRTLIAAAGLGDRFTHSLGHGVGLDVHEWPRVSSQSDYLLPENCVVTIEPGVYIPGQVGVRIEDMVLLREGGREVLTRSPKELLVL